MRGACRARDDLATADPRRPATITGSTPQRSTSTAWRKLTPWAFITQSITDPPTWQAPRQCHRPLEGVTTSEGVSSSWNGQRPTRSLPLASSTTPERVTSSARSTSAFQPLDHLVGDAGHGLPPQEISGLSLCGMILCQICTLWQGGGPVLAHQG